MATVGKRMRYGMLTQCLHWATAMLVLVAFIYGPGGSEQRVYSLAKDFDRQLHETLGMSVFAITLVRLTWRVFDARPDPLPMAAWMRRSSRLVHAVLYALLVLVPVTAMAGAWLEGHPLTLLGGVTIGPLLPEVHATGRSIASIHTWLGDAILWIAGAHAAAALFHHFVLRDAVLRSMLPGRSEA
jgi:cytochrome b561